MWLRGKSERAIYECYAGNTADCMSAAEINVSTAKYDGVRYIVCSSLEYDRFRRGSILPGQTAEVYRLWNNYEAMFNDYEYIEFRPHWRTIGFNDPTIRIIDIGKRKPQARPEAIRRL